MVVISGGNWDPLCLGNTLYQESEDQTCYTYVSL